VQIAVEFTSDILYKSYMFTLKTTESQLKMKVP